MDKGVHCIKVKQNLKKHTKLKYAIYKQDCSG
jgi:hypothetical protein